MLPKKYGAIYNNSQRIAVYNREERGLLLKKYRKKKGKRVWTKKIRYGCRKNLADKRLRIKGRFVKRDSPEAKAYFAALKEAETKG